jgi:cytochrome c2
VSRIATVVVAFAASALAGCDWSGSKPFDDKHVDDGDPVRGRAIVTKGAYGCTTCHAVPEVKAPRGVVGPPLDGMARRSFIAGRLPNKPGVLVAFLQDPPALVPETGMPNVGLRLEDARHVAAYLYTLEPSHAP